MGGIKVCTYQMETSRLHAVSSLLSGLMNLSQNAMPLSYRETNPKTVTFTVVTLRFLLILILLTLLLFLVLLLLQLYLFLTAQFSFFFLLLLEL